MDKDKATALKARESWHMFTIMAEFIDSTERLANIGPAVTIFWLSTHKTRRSLLSKLHGFGTTFVG